MQMKHEMKTTAIALIVAAGAVFAQANMFGGSDSESSTSILEDLAPSHRQGKKAFGTGELKFTGRHISASRQTGELSATGGVTATSGEFRFFGDEVTRDANGFIDFGPNSTMTTCTNDFDHLHWRISGKAPAGWLPGGKFTFQDTMHTNSSGELVHRALTIHNMWGYWYDIPVFWAPFWYYPLDTNYGWRLLPGYTSRWGGYLLGGYVYNIVNEGNPDAYSLGGSSYAQYRTKNGFALGQTIRWGLKDFGKGKFKVWHGWDEDADRYRNHWTDDKHNYRNWGSDVERRRYRLLLQHMADFTERDHLRLSAQYLSDSHVIYDFFRHDKDRMMYPSNEAWYEHRENSWALGANVSGPVNRFYGGTKRTPEGWLAIEPQPIWDLPVNYESQTRAGYLNRDSARYGSAQTAFANFPYIGLDGRGADYQAFRADTEHRITAPMKFWDVLSVVPRASYRCTWWSDSGDHDTAYLTSSGDAVARHIFEIGATASARAKAWLNDDWRHTFEPYIDYSLQKANVSSSSRSRYYVFDSYDRSVEWLDQFGFEGRGLPYSWHGVRPGIRNLFQRRDDKGVLRTILDTDLYLAVPFEDEAYYAWDRRAADGISRTLRGRARDDEYGNYNRTECVVPGFRARYNFSRDISFSSRVEYDCEENRFAYADISLMHRITDDFTWFLSYTGRDYCIFDYLATESEQLANGNTERWNWELDNVISVGFRHDVCDWLAWSPYVRFEARRSDVEEAGVWVDFLTDCLGYRVKLSHEDRFRRMDGSKSSSDDSITFYIYLRALGPGSVLDLMKF